MEKREREREARSLCLDRTPPRLSLSLSPAPRRTAAHLQSHSLFLGAPAPHLTRQLLLRAGTRAASVFFSSLALAAVALIIPAALILAWVRARSTSFSLSRARARAFLLLLLLPFAAALFMGLFEYYGRAGALVSFGILRVWARASGSGMRGPRNSALLSFCFSRRSYADRLLLVREGALEAS